MYSWIKATVMEGKLSWSYRACECEVDGSQSFDDEDVSNWSDDDIRDLTTLMLDVHADQVGMIEISWE